MPKVVIKSIFINSDFKGKPFINKNGEPYQRAVLTTERGNKASMYIGQNDINKLAVVRTWKAGDEVEIEIEQVGQYTNFNIPKNDLFPSKNSETLKHTTPPLKTDVAGNLTPKTPTVGVEMSLEEIEQAFDDKIYGKDPDVEIPF